MDFGIGFNSWLKFCIIFGINNVIVCGDLLVLGKESFVC